MAELLWNQNLLSYEAIVDGERIIVDGDTFAETRRADVRDQLSQYYPGWDDLDRDQQHDVLDEELAKENSPYVTKVEEELFNPLSWTQDMEGVTIEPVP